MEYKVIATADELREATESFLLKSKGTREEMNTKWIEWFMKRSEKMLGDTVRKGLYEMTLDLPYQPAGIHDFKELKELAKILRQLLEGCNIQFVEEEYNNQLIYKVEISWYPEKKKV